MERIRWAPRVQRHKIVRLYETDAAGRRDDELLEEVGIALYTRCSDILVVSAADVVCPRCHDRFHLGWGGEGKVFHCPTPDCGWAVTGEQYHDSFTGRRIMGGNGVPVFTAFVSAWEAARSPRDKMLAIDRLLHEFHVNGIYGGKTRSVGKNIIEGSYEQMMAMLEGLANGPGSTPGLADNVAYWQKGVREIDERMRVHPGKALTQTREPVSGDLTLDEAVANLSRHDLVEGLLLIGSGVDGELAPWSDIDLVIVLRDMPYPLHVGLTTIEGHLTDLLFVTMDQIEEIIALEEPLANGDWLARIVRWLENGQVLFDRVGRLGAAQQKLSQREWVSEIGLTAGYGAWASLSFNLAHTARMLAADDPLYRETALLRMSLHAPQDLLFGYFTIRQIEWTGDKDALRHLKQSDAGFLDVYRRFLAESDVERKMELYRLAAKRVCEPLGGVAGAGRTMLIYDTPELSPEIVGRGLRFWEELVGG